MVQNYLKNRIESIYYQIDMYRVLLMNKKFENDKKESKDSKNPNKLINEKSPYLLQHAYNPVHWHPWSDEAFKTAQEKDLPVFIIRNNLRTLGISIEEYLEIFLVISLVPLSISSSSLSLT